MERIATLVTSYTPVPNPPLLRKKGSDGPSRGRLTLISSLNPWRDHRVYVAPESITALISPALLGRMGLSENHPYWLRFGLKKARVYFRSNPNQDRGELSLPSTLARKLHLEAPIRLSVFRQGSDEVALGPLIGVLLSKAKVGAILAGKLDPAYFRFDRYARETGAILIFLCAAGIDFKQGVVRGCRLRRGNDGRWVWAVGLFPIPRVIYDRSMGKNGRAEATQARDLGRNLGVTVVNSVPKITKIQAFQILRSYPDLARHLPFTVPLTKESLVSAIKTYPDLYLKPNALHKGKGVMRLTRQVNGWLLQSRETWGNQTRLLAGTPQLLKALDKLVAPKAGYLIQEGLPLVTFMGNRFDFRSLVQKDGRGEWVLAGLVARIAPVGSVISSPRSGGFISPPERVIRQAYPGHWKRIMDDLEQVSLKMARRVEKHLGTSCEFGLDLGLVPDGTVKLIEINGKPLKVSLGRLGDPAMDERIYRYPIDYASFLDTQDSEAGQLRRVRLRGAPEPASPITVGVMLDQKVIARFPTGGTNRYKRMVREAQQAGAIPLFFEHAGINLETESIEGWVAKEGTWSKTTMPLPDVIYNRATYSDVREREAVASLRKRLILRGVHLLNRINSFGKLDVHLALRFFPNTAGLSPETVPFGNQGSLEQMLKKFPTVFLKANHGSHGSDVLKITVSKKGWWVRGRAGGLTVNQLFSKLDLANAFLNQVKAGSEWVIQRGIELPEIEGRFFDLRVILQKDGRGDWRRAVTLVRWAKAGQVVSNTSQGGERFPLAAFKRRHRPEMKKLGALEAAVEAAAQKAAQALEARFGRLGEIGFDLGVDRRGRVWVFEANSKPRHSRPPELPVSLSRNPFQYAAYVARLARAGRNTRLEAPQTL